MHGHFTKPASFPGRCRSLSTTWLTWKTQAHRTRPNLGGKSRKRSACALVLQPNGRELPRPQRPPPATPGNQEAWRPGGRCTRRARYSESGAPAASGAARSRLRKQAQAPAGRTPLGRERTSADGPSDEATSPPKRRTVGSCVPRPALTTPPPPPTAEPGAVSEVHDNPVLAVTAASPGHLGPAPPAPGTVGSARSP